MLKVLLKFKLSYILIALLVLFLMQCDKKNVQNVLVIPKIEKGCFYQLDKQNISFKWTAYKFTKRVGVSGTFQDIKWSSLEASSSFSNIINNLIFNIDSNSVDSQNELRDNNIRVALLANLKNSDIIQGNIYSLNLEKATAQIRIIINNVTKDLVAHLSLNPNKKASELNLNVNTTFNFHDFQAQTAISEMNKICNKDGTNLHIGLDGVNKLWPDVLVETTIPLKTTCSK